MREAPATHGQKRPEEPQPGSAAVRGQSATRPAAATTPRTRSLTARMTLVFAVVTSVSLFVAFALFYALLDRQLISSQERHLENRLQVLAGAVRADNLAVLERDPLAQLYGPAGEVLASSSSLEDRRLLGETEARRLDAHGETRELVLETTGAAPEQVRLLSAAVLAPPDSAGGDGPRVLTVGVSAEPVEKARDQLLLTVAIAAPLLIAGVALAGWRTVRAALAPVDRLRQEADAISSLDSDARLTPTPGRDELARLAATLDGMLERLRVAFGRERAFVDDASHELRTPIAVMRGELQLARTAADAGDTAGLERALRAASAENERLGRLAEDLLLLARHRAGSLVTRREPVDLLDLAHAEVARLGPVLGLRVSVSGDPAVVPADADRLRQVVANLLQNAATARGSRVVVAVTECSDGSAALSVSDNGPGFLPEVLIAAFERFVRADAARTRGSGGAGLGLAIVRAVATAHGGSASAHNGPPLGGATVTLHLPGDATDRSRDASHASGTAGGAAG